MEIMTVIFTHRKYDEMMKSYEWHKKRVENLRVVWDYSSIKPEEFVDPKNPEIMPVLLENTWANISRYYTFCPTWFQAESPEYFILMEHDVCIARKDFDKKMYRYMKDNKIGVSFTQLDSQWTNPTHPFAQQLDYLEAKQWTITSMTTISKTALEYYGESFQHLPDYWCEIRMPTVLASAGFQVTKNPFVNCEYFHSPAKGKDVPEEARSLSTVEITKALNDGWTAFHPIKNYDLYDLIERTINEKNAN